MQDQIIRTLFLGKRTGPDQPTSVGQHCGLATMEP